MKYFNLFVLIILLFSCNETDSKNKKVNFQRSKVIVNPFSVAPLTAIVQITDPNISPVDVDEFYIKVFGKNDKTGVDISATLHPQSEEFKAHFYDITKDKSHNSTVITSKESIEVPVLGLYPDYKNKVLISIKVGKKVSSDTFFIQTGEIQDTSLNINIRKCKPEKMEKGDVTWMTADQYKYDFMFDRFGNIRWIINVEGNSDLRFLKNGNLLVRGWWFENEFGEYNMLGEMLRSWKLPKQFRNHHDIFELPNGNFLVPVTYGKKRAQGYITLQDNLIELKRSTGEIVNNWDLFELMDIENLEEVWLKKETWYRNKFISDGPTDWFHMNSICYDEIKDEIIISAKHGGVMKLSRNGENGPGINVNKEFVWYMPMFDQYTIYANHQITSDYILTALNPSGKAYEDQSLRYDDFHWMTYQHHPTLTKLTEDSLQFLIFNNVHDNRRSAIVEYLVDEKNKTVKEVWQYGKNRKDLYSPAWAGVELLPFTQNRLMVTAFPKNPKLEVTKNKEIVFEFLISTSISSPKWYRGGRVNLYPDSDL